MKSQALKHLKVVLLASAAASGMSISSVLAETAAEETNTLDDIIVTATRRSEPLQKVPIAVSVITGDTMRSSNINNLRDVATQIPSLSFRTAASNKDQALFLRGIGTISTSPGVEPSTSTVIDGVVLARQGQATLDLLDIDHIEVLRGPQGTLFGKNASAGVLNIITKKPSNELDAFVDAAYYTRGNEFRGQGGISGPLVEDKVAAGVTFLASDYDGNVRNVYNGKKVNGSNRYGGRAKVLFTPSDNLEIMISGDYMHSKDTTPQGVVAATSKIAYPSNLVSNFPAFATALLPVVAGPENRQINSNYNTHATDENYGFSGQVDLTVGDHVLTSITAYRHWDNTQFQDQDRLPGPVSGAPQMHDIGELSFDQISQEVRLASPKEQFIDYVIGLYFFRGKNEETYQRETIAITNGLPVTNTGIADYGVNNHNYAIFGEGNVHFTDSFRGTAGLRLIVDDVDHRFVRTVTAAAPGIQAAFSSIGSTTNTDYSGRLGVQYDVSEDVMGYFTYSRGYKGPAYNLAFSMLAQDTGVVKPETSNAFEVGVKSKLFNNAVTFNIDAFLDKLKNFQVPFFDVCNGSPCTRLINAGKVSTRGVEAELTVKPTEGLTLNAALNYTKARIDNFDCPVGTSVSCQVDGMPLPFAPRWRANVRANYTTPISDSLDLNFGTDVSWQTKVQYSINQTPDTIEPKYAIWNAMVGVATDDGFTVNFVVKNITDKSYSPYLQQIGTGLVRFVPRDDRRYFGVNVHKDF